MLYLVLCCFNIGEDLAYLRAIRGLQGVSRCLVKLSFRDIACNYGRAYAIN